MLPCLPTRDHPRLCGEKTSATSFLVGSMGSPPPMRGKGRSCMLLQNLLGITPAYAGKRTKKFASVTMTWDHPRLCGEKIVVGRKNGKTLGSPPPMRGKVGMAVFATLTAGITPAYAGKSSHSGISACDKQDHPRLCGEKNYYLKLISNGVGSPPPMRGKAHITSGEPSC